MTVKRMFGLYGRARAELCVYNYGLWHRTAFGSDSPLDCVVYWPVYIYAMYDEVPFYITKRCTSSTAYPLLSRWL
jgi:hypothetical protein